MVVHGVRVTTPLRTALDLGRLLWRFDALAALDGFLRMGVPHDHLLLSVERFAGQRGVVQLRYLVLMADAAPSRRASRRCGCTGTTPACPSPSCSGGSSTTTAAAIYRLDLALPDLRYAAEYDGRRFHDDNDGQPEHDDDRRSGSTPARRWHIEVFVHDEIYAKGADPGPRLREGIRVARTRSGLWVPESAYRSRTSARIARSGPGECRQVPGRRVESADKCPVG